MSDGAPDPGDLDRELEPTRRDPRFVVRVVMAVIVASMAAAWVGVRAKRAAASCGAGLVRPGASVIER